MHNFHGSWIFITDKSEIQNGYAYIYIFNFLYTWRSRNQWSKNNLCIDSWKKATNIGIFFRKKSEGIYARETQKPFSTIQALKKRQFSKWRPSAWVPAHLCTSNRDASGGRLRPLFFYHYDIISTRPFTKIDLHGRPLACSIRGGERFFYFWKLSVHSKKKKEKYKFRGVFNDIISKKK